MTTLHAGGKFGGEGYKISGGLHGVGVSVVNALSSRLAARDPPRRRQVGAGVRQGRQAPGQDHARSRRRSSAGPRSRSGPTPTIFEETEFRAQTLLERLREMAFLNKGLEIRFTDERPEPELEQTFKFNGGIVDFVKHLNASKEPHLQAGRGVRGARARPARSTSRCSGTPATTRASTRSPTTSPPPRAGCTRRASRRPSPTRSTSTPRNRGLLKEKDDNLLGEDIREGLTAIVSVKLRNPQFEGQTKAKLGNTEMRSFVEKATNEKLGDWLEEHPAEGRQIVGKATQAQRARMAARQARDLTRRKSAARLGRRCRASSPTARRRTRASPSCSSSRATAPAAAPSTPATRSSRRSSRSAGRSSTSSAPASTDAQERRDPGAHHRDRRRRRRGLRRSRRSATTRSILLTDADVDGCAHPHAAAHVLLPADARAGAATGASTSPSRRCTASTSARSATT